MLEFQQKNCFFLANFDVPMAQQTQFCQPEYWQQQQRILGYAKGRGTTWFIQTQDLFGVNTALRHYYRGGIWGKFNKDLYYANELATTRSFAEFRLLNELKQAGLPVPTPIMAKVERLPLGFYRADLLSERIDNAQDLTAYLQQHPLTAMQWQQIGQLIRRLHNLQICHSDLNAHNILLQQQQHSHQFWLIDFDKCGKRQGEHWKADNLSRLRRSFLKEVERMNILFQLTDWQALLLGYQQ